MDPLHKAAIEARNRAHAPYSKKLVGAAVETNTGEIFAGCNVENASYGGTVCAERVAIFKAVSELGKLDIKRILVVTDADEPWPPCGFCRQVIAEFATDKTQIEIANLEKIKGRFTFAEILPHSFSPQHLD